MRVLILNPPSKYAKNVVRDLFYGCWCKGKRIAAAEFPPTTLLSVYTIIKEEGHETHLFDSQAEKKGFKETKEEIKKIKPEVIIIPTSTMSFVEDCKNLNNIKKNNPCITMAFGSHVTFFPKISLQQKGLDYVILKEPEPIIKDLLNALDKKEDPKKVLGVGFKKGKKITINKLHPFVNDLDSLPIPDRKPILKYAYFNPLIKKTPWVTAITSRGCPGRCDFCTSPSFYGNTYRYNSAERVVKEIEYLISLGYKEIFFRDETFTGDYKRTENICKLIIKKGIKISWLCSARVNTVDEKLIKLMKQAGCHMLRFGIESGVQQILNNIRKGTTIQQAKNVFKWCKKYKMETHAHTMLGCPGETWQTINQTIKFLKELGPTTLTCGAYTPYPGTPIFEFVKKKVPEIGDGSKCDLSKVHNVGFYSDTFCNLSNEEVGKAVKKMYKDYYLRPSYILKTLLRIKSPSELRRIIMAGLNVLSFTSGKGE